MLTSINNVMFVMHCSNVAFHMCILLVKSLKQLYMCRVCEYYKLLGLSTILTVLVCYSLWPSGLQNSQTFQCMHVTIIQYKIYSGNWHTLTYVCTYTKLLFICMCLPSFIPLDCLKMMLTWTMKLIFHQKLLCYQKISISMMKLSVLYM